VIIQVLGGFVDHLFIEIKLVGPDGRAGLKDGRHIVVPVRADVLRYLDQFF
jgi:hypothetical protein